jgi:hypothetical protein
MARRITSPAAAGLGAVLAAVLLTLAALASPGAQRSGPYAFPFQVTSVEVRQDEAKQIVLDVEGVIPSGCAQFEQVVQWREGDQIVVRLLARHSGAEVCTMIAQIYRGTVLVDGPLPPGEYVIDVNGVMRGVRVE